MILDLLLKKIPLNELVTTMYEYEPFHLDPIKQKPGLVINYLLEQMQKKQYNREYFKKIAELIHWHQRELTIADCTDAITLITKMRKEILQDDVTVAATLTILLAHLTKQPRLLTYRHCAAILSALSAFAESEIANNILIFEDRIVRHLGILIAQKKKLSCARDAAIIIVAINKLVALGKMENITAQPIAFLFNQFNFKVQGELDKLNHASGEGKSTTARKITPHSMAITFVCFVKLFEHKQSAFNEDITPITAFMKNFTQMLTPATTYAAASVLGSLARLVELGVLNEIRIRDVSALMQNIMNGQPLDLYSMSLVFSAMAKFAAGGVLYRVAETHLAELTRRFAEKLPGVELHYLAAVLGSIGKLLELVINPELFKQVMPLIPKYIEALYAHKNEDPNYVVMGLLGLATLSVEFGPYAAEMQTKLREMAAIIRQKQLTFTQKELLVTACGMLGFTEGLDQLVQEVSPPLNLREQAEARKLNITSTERSFCQGFFVSFTKDGKRIDVRNPEATPVERRAFAFKNHILSREGNFFVRKVPLRKEWLPVSCEKK